MLHSHVLLKSCRLSSLVMWIDHRAIDPALRVNPDSSVELDVPFVGPALLVVPGTTRMHRTDGPSRHRVDRASARKAKPVRR